MQPTAGTKFTTAAYGAVEESNLQLDFSKQRAKIVSRRTIDVDCLRLRF